MDKTTIQLRRGDAAEWSAANPVLASGEPGLELDTKVLKWGDGTTAWNDLAPFGSGGGAPAGGGGGGSARPIGVVNVAPVFDTTYAYSPGATGGTGSFDPNVIGGWSISDPYDGLGGYVAPAGALVFAGTPDSYGERSKLYLSPGWWSVTYLVDIRFAAQPDVDYVLFANATSWDYGSNGADLHATVNVQNGTSVDSRGQFTVHYGPFATDGDMYLEPTVKWAGGFTPDPAATVPWVATLVKLAEPETVVTGSHWLYDGISYGPDRDLDGYADSVDAAPDNPLVH